MALTDVEKSILEFERSWWKYAGARDSAIRVTFGWSPVRHAQVLNALLDRPETLEHDPVTVRRLLRLRTARRAQRTAGFIAAG